MSRFELDPAGEMGPTEGPEPRELRGSLLVESTQWIIRVRWVAAAVAMLWGGVAALSPTGVPTRLVGLPGPFCFALAAAIVAANTFFLLRSRHLNAASRRTALEQHLWLQVGLDFALLTIVLHLAGRTGSPLAFAYLFHIVIASVFLSASRSLAVTLVAIGLYLGCVWMNLLGVTAAPQSPAQKIFFAGSTAAVWLVTWYLVSTLTRAIRRRDEQLNAAHRRILWADQEQNRQVLRTTHDLKGPFSGIETSIQALRVAHWKEIPSPVQDIIERIERRSERIRRRISDILLLGELRSEIGDSGPMQRVDVHAVLKTIAAAFAEDAAERQVALRIQGAPAVINAGERHLSILLSNLVSNALSYSREGSEVLACCEEDEREVRVTVTDQGIGIRTDALPHIFEDYFRTREAAGVNKLSTGLGLAIVKRIAARYRFRLWVESEEESGTTVGVIMPKALAHAEQGGQKVAAHIKIIDDDPDQAQDLAGILTNAGHTVSIRDNIQGAVEDLAENTPDLLILDVMFPENPSAGMELAIKIRQNAALKTMPVIMLTGVNQEFPLNISNRDIDEQWLPVQEFVEKPVNGPQILAKVSALLKDTGTAT